MSSEIKDGKLDEDSFTILDEIGDGQEVDFSPEEEPENPQFVDDEDLDTELASGSKENLGDEEEVEDHQTSNLEQLDDDLCDEVIAEDDEEFQLASQAEYDNEKNDNIALAKEDLNKVDSDEKLSTVAQQNVSDGKEKPEHESTQEKLDDSKLSENLDEPKVEEVELEEEAPEPEVETHPYLYLIENFEVPKEQLNFTTVGACKGLSETPVYIISTRQALIKLLQSLRNAKEISLDLHMEDKEYKSSICLIEISTKDVDYIIDVQKLKNEVLLLTEIFINPKIVKIMFKAEPILACLQQRLRLYVVNIFDVEKAKLALFEAPQKHWSVLSLIKNDYSLERDKLSNADFRLRPINDTYKTFCRFIPHYLIYMYHDYKNKLLVKDQDLYNTFLSESRDACKKLYADSRTMALHSLEAELKNRHNCELDVLKKLFTWRNQVARKTNMKIEAVLHKGGLMNMVKYLPVEESMIYNFCNSPFVKKDVKTIINIIYASKVAFHVYDKKPKQRFKRLSQANIINETGGQLERPLKRKNEYIETQNKQRRIEARFTKGKPTVPNNFWKQKQAQAESLANKKFVKRNKNFQNVNTPSRGNNFKLNPFLNRNMNAAANVGEPSFARFEPAENLQQDDFNNGFNMNMQKPMMLNPTNVPSPMTFEASPTMSSGGSRRNQFEGFRSNNSNNYPNFIQKNRIEKEEEILQRSLKSLKQARDNIRRQSGSSDNFGGRRYQDLNTIDQKINTLDRKVSQIQARNNRNRYEPPSRRRY